mmetsp:Transcript_25899/g.46923  ORF Transcript_25899/g.46923 Transcript_25899/m.46923 type:complete len:973 (-) Transcript_25899:202-3120(-)
MAVSVEASESRSETETLPTTPLETKDRDASYSSGDFHTMDHQMPLEESLHVDLKRALELIQEERHLVAYDLYCSVKCRIATVEQEASPSSLRMRSKLQQSKSSALHWHHTSMGKLKGLRLPKKTEPSTPDQRQDNEPIMDHSKKLNDLEQAKQLLERRQEEFDRLEQHALLFQAAKEDLTLEEDWILTHTSNGIMTYYRREEDNSLTVKLEGDLTGVPLFEQLAILREVDLFHTWSPFCIKSEKIAQLGTIDVAAWFLTGLPKFGIVRDGCYRALGCDCMEEDASIMIVGQGLGDKVEDGVTATGFARDHHTASGGNLMDAEVESGPYEETISAGTARKGQNSEDVLDDKSKLFQSKESTESESNGRFSSSYLARDKILDTVEIPPIPKGFGAGRVTIKAIQGKIEVLSPDSARTKIVVNIDPNLKFLPQALLDFAMKKLCGSLLARLQSAAQNILNDPIHNPHAKRMREDVAFYRDWLYPKFENYCKAHEWEMPEIAALAVRVEELEEDELVMWDRRNPVVRRSVSSPVKLSSKATARSPGASRNRVVGSPNEATDATSFSVESPRSNRIRAYFDQVEAKSEAKKADQIKEARKMAADRLKPLPFTEDEKKRLETLKEAKMSRVEGGKFPRKVKPEGVNKNDRATGGTGKSGSCEFSSNLTAIAALVIAIFIALYSDPLGVRQYVEESVIFQEGSTWSSFLRDHMLRDALTVGFLFFYAALDWAIMSLTLLYAFDHIEMGQKSGRKSRKLFFKTARIGCAILAGLVVAWSIGGPVLYAAGRAVVSRAAFFLGMDTVTSPLSSVSWRKGALETARFIISNGTVFFLSCLVLANFIFPAKKRPKQTSVRSSLTTLVQMDTSSDAGASARDSGEGSEQSESTVSSPHVVKRRPFSSLRNLNIKPAVIHEGDEGAEVEAQASDFMSISQGRSDEAPLVKRKGRRFHFRKISKAKIRDDQGSRQYESYSSYSLSSE